MNALDYVVLVASMVGIALYGMWRTRGRRDLSTYLRGGKNTRWWVIGLSVMATQASAITFISGTGQGYQGGLDFVQNYFGLPLAMVIIAAVFLPIYRHLKVFTAYEYLGRRFDAKTRLLGAGLFLLQRGFAAGITIYAPAIILSTTLGWRLDLTIVLSGLVVTAYTTLGGSEAVNLTQKYQMAVILGGMAAAFVVVVVKLPHNLSVVDALATASDFNKLEAVSFSTNLERRYTFWTGLLGGVFLSLSYFGTDQSQVQRYLGGESLRESRLGLMFNAVLKIPMQFFILLLGVFVFVFYQFASPPIFFNKVAWAHQLQHDSSQKLLSLENEFAEVNADKQQSLQIWLAARHAGDTETQDAARDKALAAFQRGEAIRDQAKKALVAADATVKGNDADYVFVTFILDHLPHGLVGLLIAAFFAATLQSKAAELNALASTTVIDFYRHLWAHQALDSHYVVVTKCFTAFWGCVAIGFALFANLTENLIQAANIVASIFYGVILGMFMVAFFVRPVRGTAVFAGALSAQALVIVLYFWLPYVSGREISYLWYNLIGCAACVTLSLLLQALLGFNGERANP